MGAPLPAQSLLTPRWFQIPYHPVQHAYYYSKHRFNTVPAGCTFHGQIRLDQWPPKIEQLTQPPGQLI